MHRYFTDMFDGIELGARATTYSMSAGGVSAPSTARPAKTPPSAPSAPSTRDKVREAVKDGKVNSAERTVFERSGAREAVKDEQDRLRTAVREAGGDPVEQPRPGTPYGRVPARPTEAQREHAERVEDLVENKEHGSLEALDREAEQLEERGQTAAADSVRRERETRASAEGEVLDVIEDRESLIGTLEAEKVTIEGDANPDAANNYRALKEEANEWIQQFNANGGQYYEGNDLFGDDWDTSEVDFDRLAERFYESPELLEDFAASQGLEDGHLRGKSEDEVYARIEEYGKSEERSQVRARYIAAQELTGIMERYIEARTTAEEGGGRIEEIDAEITELQAANEHDMQALSAETLAEYREANQRDADILPTETTDYMPGKSAPSSPSDSDAAGDGEGTGETGDATGTDGSTEAEGSTEGSDGGDDAAGEGDGIGGDQPAGPTTREVEIDYSTPERRAEVLQQAQERSLLPAQNTTFDEQGQAVYTVQPGDSYWRVSDMSDGRGPNEFDHQHFLANVQVNSERLGRDPRSGLIHPNEQLVIQGRSIEELVAIMQLPTTETVEVEQPDAEGNYHVGNGVYVR